MVVQVVQVVVVPGGNSVQSRNSTRLRLGNSSVFKTFWKRCGAVGGGGGGNGRGWIGGGGVRLLVILILQTTVVMAGNQK